MFGPLEIFGGFAAVVFLFVILTSIFWIWMLIDCLTNPRLPSTEKLIWVLVIFFLHFVGALIYLFVGRQQRISGL
jgi:Phospholipase_D-nuclease N-terminal